MNDNDINGWEPHDDPFTLRMVKVIALVVLAAALLILIALALTAGCVTASKNAYASIMETPTPMPTPNITPTITPNVTQTPAPIITEDPQAYMLRTNGYHMRDWVHWFRPDVQGINGEGKKDLSTWVTVYGYKLMPSYHYYSVSWARNFLVKPENPNDQFLFIFVNMYSDGDDVRQYAFDYNHFAAQVGDRIYHPDFVEYPERRIVELDEVWAYDHVESLANKPYGYRVVQEKGTGIISAYQEEWIMGGRSNAHDGYIIIDIPYNATAKDIKILGSFANLGGDVWWQLE